MSNTYSQITIHAVFAVKFRENTIAKHWRDELHQYISGIITNSDGTSLAVGGWSDHVHILFGMPVTVSIADFMRVIKTNSSKWINQQKLVKGKFQWQEGYGVFSFAKSQRNVVIKYIMNQEEHHRIKTFQEEYTAFLTKYGIEYDERYVWD